MTMPLPVEVHRYLEADNTGATLSQDVRTGLTAVNKWLPPKWFYDSYGGELFDQITRLDEYYPTRAERTILQARADDIAALSDADTLIELGSGTSDKTRLLLDALARRGRLARFIPFDVDETTLIKAGEAVAAEYPGVRVSAVVGDFDHHLDRVPTGGSRMIAFLGSTIGNFAPQPRARFLSELANTLSSGEHLLLGTDLVKDPARLVAAYDDAQGVTAEFNRNVLRVIDRELGADFDADSWQHVALWDAEQEWIEMRLRTPVPRTVHIAALDLTVEFSAGEEIHTEISAKQRRGRVTSELAAAGLRLDQWWTDPDGDFGLSLSTKI